MLIAILILETGCLGDLVIGLVARFVRQRRLRNAASYFLSLAVVLYYVTWLLRYQLASLELIGDWGFGLTRFGLITILVLGGLALCWHATSGQSRAFGVAAILAGFALAYPGLVLPIEYT